jgi:hypothetical protein
MRRHALIGATTLTARLRTGLKVALAVTLTVPHIVHAQGRSDRVFDQFRTDSVAWQRVLAYVVSALSVQLVSASADTSAQPWNLHIAPSEPQRNLLKGQLRTILRSRVVTGNDPVFHTLDIGPLRVQGDTARVEIGMHETRRCPGTTRTTGSGWTTTVLVPRHPQQKSWGAAFSRTTSVGDKVSC